MTKHTTQLVLVVGLLLISLHAVVLADQVSCGKYTASDGSKYDLSGLTIANGRQFNVNSQDYFWNYCASVSTDAMLACGTSMMYIVNSTATPCFSIAPDTSAITIFDGIKGPSNGVQINYTSPTGCVTTLRVNCDSVKYLFSAAFASPARCSFILAVMSSDACPLNSSSRISNGAIFLIVFFSSAAVYLIVGSLIKWKVKGVSPGIEMIPQIELWVQVPGLVLDGLRFTKDKILGLIGKSEYSSV
jgi:hypothetical protein